MRQILVPVLVIIALGTGCATKGYVRQSVEPVQTRVDQVADQTQRQGGELTQARQDIDRNTTAIAATDEKATTADRRAGDALNRVTQVDQKADRTSQELGALRQTVANLDNYRVVEQTAILFGFDRATLTQEHRQQLDQLIARTANLRRYFIAVEGYADQTGDETYNLDLSERRSKAVVQYLAGQRDVDFNRIHTIGLGEQKPADTSTSSEARARNRRVEVKIYSADESAAGGISSR